MAKQDDIEADPAILADKSNDYEPTGYSTSTESLASSIKQYVYENGRRYHDYYGSDKSMFPTDEIEQDRMDLNHEIFLLELDGDLHKAPIGKNPQRILDVGTGTGIWAIDMADRYPRAEVIGIDLSPIQPKWIPPNCRFEVDDVERDFVYGINTFDFIHARNIGQSITNWPKLMFEIYRCIKPGGYVELAELGGVVHSDDNTISQDNGLKVFSELFGEAMVKLGRPASMLDTTLIELIKNAGFEDVTVAVKFKQPLAPWPKDKKLKKIGAMLLMSGLTGYNAYGMRAFTRVLGMSREEAEGRCNDALNACRNKNYHMFNYFYVVYGRKPGGNC